VFGILFNAAGIYFERILDIYVGKGEEHVVEIAGSENWDKEYYTSDFASAEDCDVFAKDVTYRIGTEGITLNDAICVLQKATGSIDKFPVEE
jgi:beta-glucosidase